MSGNENQNRHPAGTSLGGKFAPGAAAEVDDSLDDPAVADDGVKDFALEREMNERLGVDLDDCPGLREKWNETYDVDRGGSPRTNKLRADHIEDMAQGIRPPWSVLADADEYERADNNVKTASYFVASNQTDDGVSSATVRAARVYSRALRGESGTPPINTPDISVESLDIGRERSDGDYMHFDDLDQATVARLNRGVVDGDEAAKVEAGTYLSALDGLKSVGDEYNVRADHRVSVLNERLDQRWALGWSGDPAKMPARPNRINPVKHHHI